MGALRFLFTPDLWLLAEGRSSTMMTSKMVEKSSLQKASSTHRSRQPCGGRGGETAAVRGNARGSWAPFQFYLLLLAPRFDHWSLRRQRNIKERHWSRMGGRGR